MSFNLTVPLQTSLRMKALKDDSQCRFCLCPKAQEYVECRMCGFPIKHDGKGKSIAHTCFDCNVETGKGE